MDEERRKADESFKFKMVEQMASVQVMLKNIETHMDKLDDNVTTNYLQVKDIGYALYGGPRPDDKGLLEKHRDLAKKWAWLIAVIGVLANSVGYVVKEYLRKAINTPIEGTALVKKKLR